MVIVLNFITEYLFYFFFFFNDTATTEIYTTEDTLSLHDALPIFFNVCFHGRRDGAALQRARERLRDRGAVGVQLLLPQLPDRAGKTLIVFTRLQFSCVHLLLQSFQLFDEALKRNRCHRGTPGV